MELNKLIKSPPLFGRFNVGIVSPALVRGIERDINMDKISITLNIRGIEYGQSVEFDELQSFLTVFEEVLKQVRYKTFPKIIDRLRTKERIFTEQEYNSYQESMKVIRKFNLSTGKTKEDIQALKNAYQNIENLFNK